MKSLKKVVAEIAAAEAKVKKLKAQSSKLKAQSSKPKAVRSNGALRLECDVGGGEHR